MISTIQLISTWTAVRSLSTVNWRGNKEKNKIMKQTESRKLNKNTRNKIRTGLTVAVMENLLDQRNVEFALSTFCVEIEDAIHTLGFIGFTSKLNFCRIFETGTQTIAVFQVIRDTCNIWTIPQMAVKRCKFWYVPTVWSICQGNVHHLICIICIFTFE